jgi:hypothetical protein
MQFYDIWIFLVHEVNIEITMILKMRIKIIKKEEAWLYAANYLDGRKTYNVHM